MTDLIQQKDSERLALLKEVAGTKVYEAKRAESTKIMEETGQSFSTSLYTTCTSWTGTFVLTGA